MSKHTLGPWHPTHYISHGICVLYCCVEENRPDGWVTVYDRTGQRYRYPASRVEPVTAARTTPRYSEPRPGRVCSNCGHRVLDGNSACRNCGSWVSRKAVSA